MIYIVTGECIQVLEGHTDEIFSCIYNYEGDIILTGSKDNTCRIWKWSVVVTEGFDSFCIKHFSLFLFLNYLFCYTHNFSGFLLAKLD